MTYLSSLLKRRAKKKKRKKISKKRKAKAALATSPNKFQLKHPYSKRVGTTADMMKQFYWARISLRDMEKDYIVSTINHANKETPYLQASSNIVAQTIEANTTNSMSKLEIINENINNSSSDHPHNSKEIEYVNTIAGTSIRNRATKTKLDNTVLNQIEKESRLSQELMNLGSFHHQIKLTLGDLKILDWNEVSSHKEEKRILRKFYLSKKKNVGYWFTGKVGIMITFTIR